MIPTKNFVQVEIHSGQALHDWLTLHHAQTQAVWLVTFKAHVADRFVPRDAVLDALMCFGWIDGIRRVLDADRTMQLIAPRRTLIWAQSYKDRVARLQKQGLMLPPGLAAVTAAKDAGQWDALDHVDALVMPEDLLTALAAVPDAAAWFARSAPSYRRNVLRWIAQAKTAPTRARRITLMCTQAQAGQKVPQF